MAFVVCTLAIGVLAVSGATPLCAAQIRLQWEPQLGTSTSTLTIFNVDQQPLAARGWAIYFNCDAGVRSGVLTSHLEIDSLGGTYYRLHPVAGFNNLAVGAALRATLQHFDELVNVSQAPAGPYLVLDNAPDIGQPITDYQISPGRSRGSAATGIDVEALFRRNATTIDISEADLPPVFPTPLHFERREGELRWLQRPHVVADASLSVEVAFANQLLDQSIGDVAGVGTGGSASLAAGAQPPLRLAVAAMADQKSPEAYTLSVDPVAGVAVIGNSAAGVARGLQSLRALLPAATPAGGVRLPAWVIKDAPRFEYRGLQLDVARNFQRKEVVFKVLDLMARYKLNTLHLHLTDDEGWRLEIAGLPELTQIGGRRGHSRNASQLLQPAYGSGPNASDSHGSGYYTGADFVEILRHAEALRIAVIPELEMPGHARAAVKAMSSARVHQYRLNDPHDASKYVTAQYYTDDVMDPGVPSTYKFIDHVVNAMVAIYAEAGVPLRTIHVGGDELPTAVWQRSPSSQALMKRLGMKSTAELWDYFYSHVNQILRGHGLYASGWEEMGSRRVVHSGAARLEPNPALARYDARVYVWNDTAGAEDLGYRLANAGYKTILAPASHVYFDMMYNRDPQEPGARWQPAIELDTVYDFTPLASKRRATTDTTPTPHGVALSEAGLRNILGLEGQLFSETVREPERIDYMLMPRVLALAERAWAANPPWALERNQSKATLLHDAAWSVFVNQLGKQVLPRLDAEHPAIAYRIPAPGLAVVDGQVLANMQMPGFTLRYTLDGTKPTGSSPRVVGPIAAHGSVQVAAFNGNDRMSSVSGVINR